MQHKKNMGKKFFRLSFCRVLYVGNQVIHDHRYKFQSFFSNRVCTVQDPRCVDVEVLFKKFHPQVKFDNTLVNRPREIPIIPFSAHENHSFGL
jgi:hypothetical protein